MSNERILIVEDDRGVADFIETTLCALGYIVASPADSGELAIHRAIRFKPDLVLMDIDLEGAMDGIEAAKKIYSSIDVPVIFVTSLKDEATFLRAKSAEPYGFILKPFTPQVLGNTIEIALFQHGCSRKRAMRAARESEEKCRTTYRNAAAGVIADTLKGKAAEANPLWLGILGCNSMKDFLSQFGDADQKLRMPHGFQDDASQPQDLKLQSYGPDGSTTWISERKRFIRKSGGMNS